MKQALINMTIAFRLWRERMAKRKFDRAFRRYVSFFNWKPCEDDPSRYTFTVVVARHRSVDSTRTLICHQWEVLEKIKRWSEDASA